MPAGPVQVCLEIGKKRVFAVALDWPGWSRPGKDEVAALHALVDYGPRYRGALGEAGKGLNLPKSVSDLKVTQRIKGDATTDFGTPGMIPARDKLAMDEAEIRRQQEILLACWRVFDAVARSARGKALRTGPRGGGRDLNRIISHVFEAEHAYLVRLGWVPSLKGTEEVVLPDRKEILTAVAASARGELPAKGPRGGMRWPARYYVRRAAWHILDHAWEIQDRRSG